MAYNQNLIESICWKVADSHHFDSDRSKSFFLLRTKDAQNLPNAISECMKSTNTIDSNKEKRLTDIDIRTLTVEEFVALSKEMKMVSIPTKYGSKILKAIDIPHSKDGGLLIISDFGDFESFNSSMPTHTQEDVVLLTLYVWNVIFITSNTDETKEPDCLSWLHKKGAANLGSYLNVDEDDNIDDVKLLHYSESESDVLSEQDEKEIENGVDFGGDDEEWDWENQDSTNDKKAE